jgi:hypothetical protein
MPSSLIRSKFVAFDSSHLSNVVRDTFSSEPAHRQKAAAFERAFENSGSVLLLSWHHLQELLSHENRAVIEQRLEYVASKRLVASLKSFKDDSVVGTITDVQAREVAAAFHGPALTLDGVRDAAAEGMFTFGSGRDIVRPFMESWSPVSKAFAGRGHRHREIVAISRSDFTGVGHLKVADLLNQSARSPEEAAQQLSQMKVRLEKDIQTRGDKRIRDPAQTSKIAQAFMDDVARMGSELTRSPHPVMQILSMIGVDISEIGPETTIDDLGRLSTFRRKLEILNQSLELAFDELKAKITAERLPSSVIQAAVEKFRPDTSEWKGSDLPDSYLASLAAYADITFVDRRTHEALRQARPKWPELCTILKRTEKARDYDAVARIVAD